MPHVRRCVAILLVLLLVTTQLGTLGPGAHEAIAATPKVRLSPTSGYVGDTVAVSVSGFPKNRAVTLAWDGKTIATIKSSAAGDGASTFDVPVAKKGAHTVSATAGGTAASASFSVKPRIRLSPSTVVVGGAVSATLRGYAKGESIAVALDSTAKTLTTVIASGSGSASVKVVIPPAYGGRHKLIGSGNAGSQSTASLTVTPSLALTPTNGSSGTNVRLAVRGFGKGERIEIQWQDPRGTRSMAFATASSTGSANVTVTIPKVAAGAYAIRTVGYTVSFAEAPFQVT